MRRIAITDIHGCNATFNALLEQLRFSREDELYLLGDYIDRGPDSKGVIDSILRLRESGHTVHCLMGNHELMMINAFEEQQWKDTWFSNGGRATMRSFQANSLLDIPESYLRFLLQLPFHLEADNFLMVHAGINFQNREPLDDTFSLLWIRDWYDDIDFDWLGDRIILHGHTPIPRAITEQQYEDMAEDQVLDLDCGCVFNRPLVGLGYLCALDMTNRELHFQRNVEANT